MEHLDYEDAIRVLKGFHLILKPGATLHVIVPDLEIRAKRYFEQIGDPKDTSHHWIYDQSSITPLLQEQGFHILPKNETPSGDWRKTNWDKSTSSRKNNISGLTWDAESSASALSGHGQAPPAQALNPDASSIRPAQNFAPAPKPDAAVTKTFMSAGSEDNLVPGFARSIMGGGRAAKAEKSSEPAGWYACAAARVPHCARLAPRAT